jgi:hypothetical protein
VGLRLLIHVALLVALLVFSATRRGGGDTSETMCAKLAQVRAELGLGPAWRRNTVATRGVKKRRKPPTRKRRNH